LEVTARHSAPSASRAFCVLVVQSFQRHWRLRQMGWIALGLLGIIAMWVAARSVSPEGWGIENRRLRRTEITWRDYGEQLRPAERYRASFSPPDELAKRPSSPYELASPLDPVQDSLSSLILSVPHAVMQSAPFLADVRFTAFARLVVLGAYLGFILPMFTLAYASGAIGGERETRTLIWLLTRPMPRGAIYLAKFLGTLPWCLFFSLGGFFILCALGGESGREAAKLFWPAALAGTLALSALFHLFGAMFRWPVVVGLVYVFFFEILVAVLPGSLKLLSLTFYARCLMYNEAVTAGRPGAMLQVTGPVSSGTAWAVLLTATAGFTVLGMLLFSRAEHRDDV
jgi:ABC-type transport system involved in multi-copper enzyme maturation permease subunit